MPDPIYIILYLTDLKLLILYNYMKTLKKLEKEAQKMFIRNRIGILTLNLMMLIFVFISFCTPRYEMKPRITYSGGFLEDRPWHPIKKHYGVDYYTPPGIPIIAAADGIVERIFDMDRIMYDY